LGVLVPTNTKLTHVFGSKVLVFVLVCYKLTLTPPSKCGRWRKLYLTFVAGRPIVAMQIRMLSSLKCRSPKEFGDLSLTKYGILPPPPPSAACSRRAPMFRCTLSRLKLEPVRQDWIIGYVWIIGTKISITNFQTG
jgi:hypothetical protein